jgi:hypothetical protein
MTKKFLAAGLVALTLAGSAASSAQAKPFFGGHHHHHGGHWGGVAAAGLLGALAVGAIAANGYGDCYYTRQPVTDAWGNVLYFQNVRVCQ